ELEELENEHSVLENASEIKSRFVRMYQNLEDQEISVLSLLNEAIQLLNQVNRLTPAYQGLSERLDNASVELKDLAAEIGDVAENVEINDERLVEVGRRLDTLYQLIKKHHSANLSELIAVRDSLKNRID